MSDFHKRVSEQPPITQDEDYTGDERYTNLFTDYADNFQSLPVFKGASSMYDTLFKNLQSMMLGETSLSPCKNSVASSPASVSIVRLPSLSTISPPALQKYGQKISFNWDFVPVLKGPKDAQTFVAADSLVMFEKCKNKDLAADVFIIQFLSADYFRFVS